MSRVAQILLVDDEDSIQRATTPLLRSRIWRDGRRHRPRSKPMRVILGASIVTDRTAESGGGLLQETSNAGCSG